MRAIRAAAAILAGMMICGPAAMPVLASADEPTASASTADSAGTVTEDQPVIDRSEEAVKSVQEAGNAEYSDASSAGSTQTSSASGSSTEGNSSTAQNSGSAQSSGTAQNTGNGGSGSLTPEGNMTLVDDKTGVNASNKEFITLTTRDGNFFYLIIDKDKDGNNNVHFLNQVDEEDLLSLMDDETAEKVSKELETGKQNSGTANAQGTRGAGTEQQGQTGVAGQTAQKDGTSADGSVSSSSASEVPLITPKPHKGTGTGMAAAGIALAGAGAGAAYVLVKAGKKKKGEKTAEDPDDGYEEEYVQPEETEEPGEPDDEAGRPDDEEKG